MLFCFRLGSLNIKAIKHIHNLTLRKPFTISFSGYGPHITVINHDADSSSQKGGAGGIGQVGVSGSSSAFLGPPGRISMITGAPSPHQVTNHFSKKIITYLVVSLT
jgi:hypothetical protein